MAMNEGEQDATTHRHCEHWNHAAARIAALEQLLVCYRTGRQPSEKLHRELARTRKQLAGSIYLNEGDVI